MKNILRFVLALLAGLLLGSAVNMGLILLGGRLIPPPAGADTTTMEGLKAAMHLFTPRHFLFPYLAHAAGTLVGAAAGTWIASAGRRTVAGIIGGLFFLGGLINCFLLPAPAWFMGLDLALAYLPMAWLGYRLGRPRGAR